MAGRSRLSQVYEIDEPRRITSATAHQEQSYDHQQPPLISIGNQYHNGPRNSNSLPYTPVTNVPLLGQPILTAGMRNSGGLSAGVQRNHDYENMINRNNHSNSNQNQINNNPLVVQSPPPGQRQQQAHHHSSSNNSGRNSHHNSQHHDGHSHKHRDRDRERDREHGHGHRSSRSGHGHRKHHGSHYHHHGYRNSEGPELTKPTNGGHHQAISSLPISTSSEASKSREVHELKARISQLEKTLKWWTDCTNAWREKWTKMKNERNKAREEVKNLKKRLLEGTGKSANGTESGNESHEASGAPGAVDSSSDSNCASLAAAFGTLMEENNRGSLRTTSSGHMSLEDRFMNFNIDRHIGSRRSLAVAPGGQTDTDIKAMKSQLQDALKSLISERQDKLKVIQSMDRLQGDFDNLRLRYNVLKGMKESRSAAGGDGDDSTLNDRRLSYDSDESGPDWEGLINDLEMKQREVELLESENSMLRTRLKSLEAKMKRRGELTAPIPTASTAEKSSEPNPKLVSPIESKEPDQKPQERQPSACAKPSSPDLNLLHEELLNFCQEPEEKEHEYENVDRRCANGIQALEVTQTEGEKPKVVLAQTIIEESEEKEDADEVRNNQSSHPQSSEQGDEEDDEEDAEEQVEIRKKKDQVSESVPGSETKVRHFRRNSGTF